MFSFSNVFCTFPRQVWTLAWAPEIQTISVLGNKPTREVFNMSTGSDRVFPEVQSVTVSYDDVDEVQTITTRQVFGTNLAVNMLLPSIEPE